MNQSIVLEKYSSVSVKRLLNASVRHWGVVKVSIMYIMHIMRGWESGSILEGMSIFEPVRSYYKVEIIFFSKKNCLAKLDLIKH